MTAQITDVVRLDEQDFSLVAVQNALPFRPEDYGLKPRGTCSACWRGHQEIFLVRESELILWKMVINVGALGIDRSPRINGAVPSAPTERFESMIFNTAYEKIDLKLPYSGGVIIGRDFQKDFYVHMGFHRPHCYKVVHELTFHQGRLTQKIDHSAKMEELRQKIGKEESVGASTGQPTKDEIRDWITACFSLDYTVKKNWS